VKPPVVRCTTLRERPYAVTETFHGLIEAKARVDMAFQIPGRIAQIGAGRDELLRENDRVEPGQVLATLDPLRHQAEAQRAEAEAESARSRMATAEARVEGVKAKLEQAKREAERLQKLLEQGAVSVRETDEAHTAQRTAQAEFDAISSELASAAAAYNSSRAAQTVANVGLQDATLKSPMSALVARIPVEVGQIVSPGQPVVTLVDTSKVKLVLRVVERKLPLLRKGQRVNVEALALTAAAAASKGPKSAGEPRTGVITLVPPAADPTTGLFHVEIELDNPGGALRPGMIGKAVVSVAERRAYAVPTEAVTHAGDDYWACFVAGSFETGLDLGAIGKVAVRVPNTVVRKVALQPVTIDKDYYLVTDLPEGLNRLVIEGQSRLADAQPVTVVDTVAAAE
jgi:RND family efflux transporter MFP subunit